MSDTERIREYLLARRRGDRPGPLRFGDETDDDGQPLEAPDDPELFGGLDGSYQDKGFDPYAAALRHTRR